MPSIRLIVFAGVFGTPTALPASAQPLADDSARVTGRWDQLRQAAPAVRYSVRWEMFPTQIKPGDPKAGENGALTGSGVVLLDPAKGRLRVDKDELLRLANRRERVSRGRMTIRYDGREQSSALVLDLDAAAAPTEPAYRDVEIGPWGASMRWPDEFNPLLWGHGLVWTSRDTADGGFPLAWRVEPGRFRPIGREEVGGRACVVFRDTAARDGSTETLWIDDERGVIVRRREERPNGGVKEIGVAYQETPHGWLPKAWEETEGRPGQPPAVGRRVRVEAVTFDPPVAEDEYRIALRPGMGVRRQGWYARVADDGSLEPMPSAGPDQPVTVTGRVVAAVRMVGWPGLVGLGVATVLAGVLVQLRRRKPVDS